jgi:hypothetical protein
LAGSGAVSEANLTERERRHLLGEAVCAFARAQTVKEANRAILTGIQKLENFTSSFIEEVRKVFPSQADIRASAPSSSEHNEIFKALWDKIIAQEDKVLSGLQEEKVLSRLAKELGTDIESVRCNQQEQSFVLTPKGDYVFRTRAERAIGLELQWFLEQLSFSPIDEPMDYSDLEHIYKVAKNETVKVFALDLSFLETLKDESLINDIISLNKLWTSYNGLVFYRGIKWHQIKTNRILKWLTDPSCSLKDQQAHYLLFEYLEIYNEMPKHVFEIDNEGNPRKRYQIHEEDYLSINLPLKWLDRIKSDLSYCLIEFLMTEGYRKWIYRCDNCRSFYVPKILHTPKSGRNFCSDKCRWEYHSSRPEVKEKKAADLRKKFGWKKREKKATHQHK